LHAFSRERLTQDPPHSQLRARAGHPSAPTPLGTLGLLLERTGGLCSEALR
jgi:hypothetical protein